MSNRGFGASALLHLCSFGLLRLGKQLHRKNETPCQKERTKWKEKKKKKRAFEWTEFQEDKLGAYSNIFM